MNNKKRQNPILGMLALIVIAIGLFAYWQQDLPGTTEKIDYAKLVQTIKDDKVKEISLQRKMRTTMLKVHTQKEIKTSRV